jgi:monovalent cation:H+ antiporter-2, CPA2 family
MHGLDLIATLAGGLTAALVFGLITQRLGLSPIVGYLLGGILVGPHTPGFVADVGLAQQLAEIGVVLLMFGVGLQFHVEELLSVRRVAIPGAIAQSVVATALGAVVGRAFGWGWPESLVLGISLSVASTVVLVRVLADNRELHTPTGHIAVGWLVVEDLFTVLVLVALPALAEGGATPFQLAGALAWTLVKVGGLVTVTMIVGTRAIPWLLDRVAATHARDLFTLTVLVLALGIAFGAAKVFGVSMALGAFLAGLVVGRSEYSLRAASEALPMRDAFAVLFFVSVGMLLNPQALMDEPWLVVATLAVVIIGKPLVALLVVLLLGRPLHVGLAVAVALAQIGEFSFILGALGVQLGIATPLALNVIVAVAIVSIMINQLLYRTIGTIERWVTPYLRMGSEAELSEAMMKTRPPADVAHRAIVIGYGPTGQTLVRLLRENRIEPTIVEFNVDTVRSLRDQGIDAVYGDASLRDTLTAAGAEKAGNLILSTDVGANGEEIIRVAREMNAKIHVVARTTHLRGVAALRHAGAAAVFSGEGEVALAMTEAVLHRLGATPEQIDRERERVRGELLS